MDTLTCFAPNAVRGPAEDLPDKSQIPGQV